MKAEKAEREYPRWRLARMTRAINRCFAAPAVVLFRHPDTQGDDDFVSLSFVHRRESKTDSAKDVLGRVSILRSIRRENPHRGHLDILKDLTLPERLKWMTAENKTANFDGLLAAWLAALDTETLNKRFYAKLLAWFDNAVKQCKFPDGKTEGKSEEQVMRMITRLLFIWFVKEKGLAPETLFTEQFAGDTLKNHQRENSDYYRAVLQNLFFGTLNTPQKERGFRKRDAHGKPDPRQYREFNLYRYADLLKNPDDFVRRVDPVPFVNGGLFDCLDEFETGGNRQDRRRIDCFTDNTTHRKLLNVPARLFFDQSIGLFPLFNQFKFTVAENTPLDQEVALDPELLGMVFENLLAAITPESSKNARRETGSFYTPRPIVDYMVDEALLAHLTGRLGKESEARLRQLLSWEDAPENAIAESEKAKIIAAIDELRILDPAVGSGAFPMGMLHKLVHILSRVDKHNEAWKKRQLESVDKMPDSPSRREAISAIERVFSAENNHDDYGRKLYLIQRVIHGVDLQPVAAQIARLRFFISLIIDQRPRDDRENRGIEPLPNLETKFVAADSLIGLSRKGQLNLGETGEVQELQDDIHRVRRNYFGEKTRDGKRRLKNKDADLRKKLSGALKKGGDWGVEDANRFAEWDVYDQTAGADWFDAELMMGVQDGFDIVIGNPPYVRHELFAAKKPALKARFGSFFAGTADLYTYFYHQGLSELRKGGHLCFITSNSFMRASFGKNLRAFLANESSMKTILDFGGVRPMDATTRPAILVTEKLAPSGKESVSVATVKMEEDISRLAEFVTNEGKDRSLADFSAKSWTLVGGDNTMRLLEKMRRVGQPLEKVVSGKIYYGIKTGCNEAFVIDEDTRAKLIAEDSKSAEIIKPWLRGRDLEKWGTKWAGFYFLFVRRDTDIEKYPAVLRHLRRHKKALLKRSTPGADLWFAVQTPTAYYREFDEPKIIYPDIAKMMRATYDKTGAFCGNTAYFIPTGDLSVLGFLNSRVFDWFARHTFGTLDDPWDGGFLRFFTRGMSAVPFPPMDKKAKLEISRRVEAILGDSSEPEVVRLESEIDQIVNGLYGLTASEVALLGKGGG